ncbi:MAG: prephenate dehydrogenase/arogenate dehydrogenase family protein [Acidobacteria bacterium]|nr:MAG: prephenate dehydrogenase/arogenate dehydrogenase family protein [Acidobacteriota bacterium]PYY08778.1 MAG: prephenate dehydrogenase/arogenate dehydrogenase family protein [Acidobacteriota bacterium]
MRQITIVGTGLIGGSLGLALKARGFRGKIVGCDRLPILERAQKKAAIDHGQTNPNDAVRGSQVVVLATPVGAIIDLIDSLGRSLSPRTLLTDVGSTKTEVVSRARTVFGKTVPKRFLAGHPMAGREQCGVEFADAHLFQGAAWLITPVPGQNVDDGLCGDFLEWVDKIGAKIATLEPQKHDRLCAWISHLPQMVSTALAASLVDEFGEDAPLLPAGGRALREMTRISASPYLMWRDIALTNKNNIQEALLKLEQRLAHIRENLDTRRLAEEFERAHHLKKS